MALNKETRDRIVAEAAAKTGFKDDEDSTPISKGHYYGYIAGATAENERAQGLVDALEMVKRTISSLIQPALWNQQIDDDQRELLKVRNTIEIALQQFKDGKGKEVGPVKQEIAQPDLGLCKECKTRPAVTDYNGHGFYVCKLCDDSLNREFENEYQ